MKTPLSACLCCTPSLLGRRAMFGLAAGLLAAPMLARAEDGTAYDSMLLSCIDPRLVEPVHGWMASRGLTGKYSQINIAGASVGVVAEPFAGWRPAFWDNLATSIQLHKIHRLIAVNHRECGAAAIAYGPDAIRTADAETELHRRVAGDFRKVVAARHPALVVEVGLMAIDGAIVML
jgi:hypothetical protein